MDMLVVMKMVPDVVEELEIAPEGKGLDLDAARMMLSESDDHALEEALLLKERYGGKVTVLAVDAPEADDALFTALAKGADRAVKITDAEPGLSTRAAAALAARTIAEGPGLMPVDLILTGTQAIDDLDGLMAPLVAYHLDMPTLSILTSITADVSGRRVAAIREFGGGVRGEFELPMPAVLGIQSSEKPPRYVPVAKVRAAMKERKIETVAAPEGAAEELIEVLEMRKPEAVSAATMLEGTPGAAAAELCGILAGRGLI
jgi:electron transfer flavoprotein beta subunit